MRKVILMLPLLLAACGDPAPPIVEVVSVPSSRPYRYIKYSTKDTPNTIRQVRDHNYRHSLVKKAEDEARKK
jgi:hypothetical protein